MVFRVPQAVFPRSIAASMDIPDLITSTEDLDMQVDVFGSLRRQNQSAMRRVVVRVVDGVITLCGPVASYHTKQTLVHACSRLCGVATVVDELVVEI